MAGNKTALGVAYLYTAIMVVFSLYGFFVIIYSISSHSDYFYLLYALYPLVNICLIIVFHFLNKKQGQTFTSILKNLTIRKATGLVISLSIILSLAESLPTSIYSFQGYFSGNSNALSASKDLFSDLIMLTGISLFINLCAMLIGVLLYTRKNTNSIGDENEAHSYFTVSGIALIFLAANCFFTLLTKVVNIMFYIPPSYKLLTTMKDSIYWLIAVLGSIGVLFITCRKHGLKLADMFKDGTIRFSAGALILVDGLRSLSFNLPQNLVSYYYINQTLRGDLLIGSSNSILSRAIKILIPVIQILSAVYLLKKKATSNSDGESRGLSSPDYL